ncbi:MAG: lipase family protein [Leptolyngbyaceae cyanobacterium CSU_1_4]|nr:lipase family protein [Leptolyngbyaceae cyanobacterium CSU_1_4]
MFFFEPNAIAYSPINAIGLAQAARLAYLNPFAIASTVHTWQFTNFHFFEQRATQAFMMSNDQVIILAFRGTEARCLKDWMTDADITLIKACGGRVHRGFSSGLEAVWQDILTQFQRLRTQNQTLFITGHSLGAALATLAAAKFAALGQAVRGLYTFGSPRVGCPEFASVFNQAFQNRAFRFVNHNDVVTRVALRSLGYDHVGKCLYFDAEGRLHEEIEFWRQFLDSVTGGMADFLNACGIVSDHNMAEYERNLIFNRQEANFSTQEISTQERKGTRGFTKPLQATLAVSARAA